jgi:hypothetical protein
VLRYPTAKSRAKHYPTIIATPVNGAANQGTIEQLAGTLIRQEFVPTQARRMSEFGTKSPFSSAVERVRCRGHSGRDLISFKTGISDPKRKFGIAARLV